MSLPSRIRARLNYLFPPTPPPPKPGPKVPGSSSDSPAPQLRRRHPVKPIHPDFLSSVDPLWPIPDEALRKNAEHESSYTRKVHPHTAFGRHGFGQVEIPESIVKPIRALVEGIAPSLLLSLLNAK